MDSATLQVFGGIVGVMATLAAIIKLLLNTNYKQQKDLLQAKADLYITRSEQLKTMIDEHRKIIDANTYEIKEAVKQLQRTEQKMGDVEMKLAQYVEVNNRKFTEINTIVKDLGNNLKMYTSNKPKGRAT